MIHYNSKGHIILMMKFLNFKNTEKLFLNRFTIKDNFGRGNGTTEAYPSCNNRSEFFLHSSMGTWEWVFPSEEAIEFAREVLAKECKEKLLHIERTHRIPHLYHLLRKFNYLGFIE